MGDYALDALAVMDEIGIGEFDLLGISFGGMVAQKLAVRFPGRIRCLVLWSTSAGGPPVRRSRSTPSPRWRQRNKRRWR